MTLLTTNDYHPEPIRTGSARVDDTPCVLCGRTDTAKYEGEASFDDPSIDEEQLCIVCIDDGTAQRELGAVFTDQFASSDGWEHVPQAVISRIRHRTAAPFTWQAARWLACCEDAAVYLGVVDESQVRDVEETRDSAVVDNMVSAAGNTAPSAYVFRCRHCGAHRTFSDEP